MRQWFVFFIIMFSCSNSMFLHAQKNVKIKSTEMNATEFRNQIWDFAENENDFKYKGKKPAIIHFYSPLSNNSKASVSILDDLAQDSKGRYDIYKVNADIEKELVRLFQIKNYPAFLFITKRGEPQVYVGFKTKEQLVQLIENTILK